jgi:hypothetical protein
MILRMSLNLLTAVLLLLLPVSCWSQVTSDHTLTLKPATPDKEVFTGDSFVITCLTNEPPSAEYKLKWKTPSKQDVPSIPTAPVYVSGMTLDSGIGIVSFFSAPTPSLLTHTRDTDTKLPIASHA